MKIDKSLEKYVWIVKMVLVVFAILYVVNFKYSFAFLIFSLAIIIILYYLQKDNMDNFTMPKTNTYNGNKRSNYHTPPVQVKTCTPSQIRGNGVHLDNMGNIIVDRPSAYRFCNDDVLLDYNDGQFMSMNQKLAGSANPKTKIPPVVIPPSHDLSYWKANNLVTHSAVNYESQQDAFQSGFQVSNCDGYMNNKYLVPMKNKHRYKAPLDNVNVYNIRNQHHRENDSEDRRDVYYDEVEDEINKVARINLENARSNYQSELQLPEFSNLSKPGVQVPQIKEQYEYPYNKTDTKSNSILLPNFSGQVNTSCGYNPKQLYEAGLPTNYPAGNCEKNPAMKEYNKNLFTQIIEPGIYSYNEVNEPINSNMGISFTQQFEPTTCKRNEYGLMYTEHDPRLIEDTIIEPNEDLMNDVGLADIYDPRQNGYGTSYRVYTDKELGQPRFMYDDIDAVKMPNYIVRSNIDNQQYADSYGPIPKGNEFGNRYSNDIRALANDSFMRGTSQFRTDLQERLLRKRNSELWQLRQMPISTSGQRGSMSRH